MVRCFIFSPLLRNSRLIHVADIIAAIVKTEEFTRVSKSDIKNIVMKVNISLPAFFSLLTRFQRKSNKAGSTAP